MHSDLASAGPNLMAGIPNQDSFGSECLCPPRDGGMRFSFVQFQLQSGISNEMGSQLMSLWLIFTERYTLASRVWKTCSYNQVPCPTLLMTVKISKGSCFCYNTPCTRTMDSPGETYRSNQQS